MKIQNNRDSASRVITNFDRQLGKYEHSSPSTKEHHAQTFQTWSHCPCMKATIFMNTSIRRIFHFSHRCHKQQLFSDDYKMSEIGWLLT